MNAPRIPMKLPKPKGADLVERLKLSIHGLIDHSNKNRRLYGSFDHWKHGSNYVVSVLHQYLIELQNIIDPLSWPKTLYLQVDNCWRKQKQNYVS